MREDIIESLESARGYIDGLIADIRGGRDRGPTTDEDALDWITASRRLRLKALVVLNDAVDHAASTNATWEQIAERYGLSVEEVQQRYPEAVQARKKRDDDRDAFAF